MAVTESVLATYDDVKFIQGTTPMNQTNWQGYFGAALLNGIYEGFKCTGDGVHKGIARVYDGTAFVNGLCATIKTESGYTTIPYDILTDRFICLRVYFNEQTAELIAKQVANGTTEWVISGQFLNFVDDESYQCTRDDEYYEIPIWYMGASNSSASSTNYDKGFDLRRIIERQKNLKTNPDTIDNSGSNPSYLQLCSNHKYEFHCASESIAAIDLINPPDEVVILINGWVNNHFSLSFVPWFENWANMDQITDLPSSTYIKFMGLSDIWTVVTDSNPKRIQMELADVTHTTYWGFKLILLNRTNNYGRLTYYIQDLFKEEA